MPATGALEVGLEAFAPLHGQAYLLEVREPAEDAGGHVPGAGGTTGWAGSGHPVVTGLSAG